jgi:hypothetical protein
LQLKKGKEQNKPIYKKLIIKEALKKWTGKKYLMD